MPTGAKGILLHGSLIAARVVLGGLGLALAALGVWQILGPDDAYRGAGSSLASHDWLVLAYPDANIILGLTVLGGALGSFRNAAPLGLFVGAAAGFIIFANVYILGVNTAWLQPYGDSPNYLSLHPCRIPGYFVFLKPFMQSDPAWLVAVQLNLLLLAKVAVSAAVYRVTASAAAGLFALFLSAMFISLLGYSFLVLTEAPYCAALGLGAAAALAYLRSPKPALAAATGLSIAAAMAIKSVAPVLVIPAAFLLLRPADLKRLNAALLLVIPLVCLLGLSALGRVANGSWGPAIFTGYQLVQHVAWGIRSDRLSSDPEISKNLETALKSLIEKWPSIIQLRDYLRVSSQQEVKLLGFIPPIVQPDSFDPKSGAKCTREIDNALLKVALEAIERYPGRYLAHVGVHFGGLWSLALSGNTWKSFSRPRDALSEADEWYATAMPEAWRGTAAQVEESSRLTLRSAKIELLLDKIRPPEGRFLQYLSLFFGALSICAAALALVFARLRPEYAAASILGLFMNAQFLGQALFSPVWPRYAVPAEILLTGFIAIAIVILIRAARDWAGQWGRS